MENKKINITAEFVAIMRAEKDPRNLFFVSRKGHRLYNAVSKVISKKKLKEIFDWRLKLSELFDEKILKDNPRQVIEIASGYSLRGFNLCLKNKDLIYIDTDLDNVISKKKEVLNKICEKENIVFPKNYHLIMVDILKDDIFEKIENILSKEEKTLVLAEGLTSYFNDKEFKLFLKNIESFLSYFTDCEFYSHEYINHPKGLMYRLLRSLFVSILTKTKRRKGFENSEEFKTYLKSINIDNFKVYSNDGFLFYSLLRNNFIK